MFKLLIYNYMANGMAKLQLLIELKNKLSVGLDAAKKHVDKTVGQMQSKMDALKISTAKVFDAFKNEVPGLQRAMNLVKNPIAGVAAGAVAVGTGFYKSVQMANDWQEQMAQINVTAHATPEELKGISDQLLKIGGRNVTPLEEVPKAFNTLIAAGLDTNTALKTLEPTLQAAKAGFTDAGTAANSVSSFMLSSGITDATKAYDIMFQTMNVGKAEFNDIAQYLPKIIPQVRSLGLGVEEASGAFGTLTKSLSPEAAATAMSRMIGALSDSDKAKNFKGIGVNVYAEDGSVRGFLDIIGDLKKSMDGLTDQQRSEKLGQLGLDINSTLGFNTLIQNFEALKQDTDAVINSAGALKDAYADAKTPMDEWKITMNQIKSYGIQIGNAILPVVTAIGRGALFVAQNIDIVGGAIAGLGVAWGILNAKLIASSVALAVTTAKQWLFNIAASANPIGIIVMTIGALIGGLIVAYNKVDKFRAILQGTWEVVKGFGNVLKEFVIDRIKGLISGLGAVGSAFQKLFSGDFKGAWKDAKKGFVDISGIEAAKNAFESTKGLKDNFTNKYSEVMSDAAKKKASEESGDFAGVPDPTNNGSGIDNPTASGGSNSGLDDAKKISGGSQTKNITINIDSFVKGGLNSTNQQINSMNTTELEKWMTEMFMRIVRSAEMAM